MESMAFLDSQPERRRLADSYSQMSNEELAKLEDDADSLTELALEILEDELDRRGLTDAPEESTAVVAHEDLAFRKLVTIRKFRDLPEALLAKGSLESVGIECFLADDNLIRLDWFISNFVGGIKLRVKAEDAESARELLEQPIPEGMYIEGVGLYEQPRCPACGSLDVSFQELNKAVAYGSAYFGLPIPLQRDSWVCHACQHEWIDEDEGSAEPPNDKV